MDRARVPLIPPPPAQHRLAEAGRQMVAAGSLTDSPPQTAPVPHRQVRSCRTWLGMQGPGRFCSLRWGSSTSRSCHQPCPPEGRGLEGATPSTGQREGPAVSQGRHPPRHPVESWLPAHELPTAPGVPPLTSKSPTSKDHTSSLASTRHTLIRPDMSPVATNMES